MTVKECMKKEDQKREKGGEYAKKMDGKKTASMDKTRKLRNERNSIEELHQKLLCVLTLHTKM